jgi:hypothetical protein
VPSERLRLPINERLFRGSAYSVEHLRRFSFSPSRRRGSVVSEPHKTLENAGFSRVRFRAALQF